MTIVRSIALASFAFLLAASAAFAQNVRLIAKGYDPVAYFTDGKAVKGDPAIAFEWDEGRYHFASQKNRDLFAAEPDRYAPRFGGYCTGSMAGGKEQPNEGDGRAWKIVYGKLYLFGSVEWRDNVLPDKPDTYAKAQQNWDKRHSR